MLHPLGFHHALEPAPRRTQKLTIHPGREAHRVHLPHTSLYRFSPRPGVSSCRPTLASSDDSARSGPRLRRDLDQPDS